MDTPIEPAAPEPLTVRATLTLRNHKMIAARERLGLSQGAVAELADVSIKVLGQIERLNFCNLPKHVMQLVDRIAGVLELNRQDILPAALLGKKIRTRFRRVFDVNREQIDDINQLPDQHPTDRLETMDKNSLAASTAHVLKTLSFREREVLKLRYGIGDGDGYTYTQDEIARIFKATPMRIRQIEAKAIRKLQHPVQARMLEGFLPGVIAR